MKRVLIPLALFDTGLNLTGMVRDTYMQRLSEVGLVPILLPPTLPRSSIDILYADCSGVLVAGGSDYNPKYYGEELHPSTSVGPDARDRVEIDLLRQAVADDKAVLAICRGCQGLNIALGGSLYQHVPEVYPEERHALDGEPNYAIWTTKLVHPVRLVAGSRIARICGADEIEMNSAHHQAVNRLGRGLRITGRSPGGCVEIIEHETARFCLGIQGHPEAREHDSVSRGIFRAFADAMV